MYMPSADPLKSLNPFEMDVRFPLGGSSEVRGGSSLNLTPLTYHRQNCSNNAVV